MPQKNNIYQNTEQDRRLGNVESSIQTINHEMGEIKIDIGGIKSTQKILIAINIMILTGLVGLFLK